MTRPLRQDARRSWHHGMNRGISRDLGCPKVPGKVGFPLRFGNLWLDTTLRPFRLVA